MRKYSVTVEENHLPFDLPPQRGDDFLVRRLAPSWQDRASYPKGTLREIWHHHEHGIHCEHRPALTITHPNGQTVLEQWYRDDALHREDAPAERRFTQHGKLALESWHRKGRLHRVDGPALTDYDPETGKVLREEWRVAGVLHRNFGPAITETGDDGKVTHSYYRQGVPVPNPSPRDPTLQR